MDTIKTHKSGVKTWEENGTPVMECPACHTDNEWPFESADNCDDANCYGGCGRSFELDD